MAECSEIEAGGEVRTIKDATARSGVAANAAAIEEIVEKIPSNASSSNKLAAQSDLFDLFKTAQITDCNSPFYGIIFCGTNVSHKPVADMGGMLLSYMKIINNTPTGVQFFIPYQGYGFGYLYFRDNTNGYSSWRKLEGHII